MNGLIKGLLITAAVAGVGAGGFFGYKAINNKNKEINNLKTEVSQLQEDNKTKSKEIETLNVKVSEKDKELAEKNKALESVMSELAESEKYKIKLQNNLNEKTTQLESANGQISTLSTQKITLLNAVTEIDNKINSTEDAVEIETLEARKSAILIQIDSLNTQISSLEDEKQALQTEVDNLKVEKQNLQTEVDNLKTQKTQLENEIASLNTQIADLRTALSQLENTTGFAFIMAQKYIYFENYGSPLYISKSVYSFKDIVTGKAETKIGDNYVLDYVDLGKGQAVDDFINLLNTISETNYAFASVSYYKFTFNGDDKCYQESPSSMPGFNDQKFSNTTVYYNGQKISDFSVLSSTRSYAIMTQTNEQNLSIYIVDKSPKGKYVSETGNYFDFDNNQSNINNSVSEISDVYFSYDRNSTLSQIVIDYSCWSYDVDSDSFEYQGENFTKSEG